MWVLLLSLLFISFNLKFELDSNMKIKPRDWNYEEVRNHWHSTYPLSQCQVEKARNHWHPTYPLLTRKLWRGIPFPTFSRMKDLTLLLFFPLISWEEKWREALLLGFLCALEKRKRRKKILRRKSYKGASTSMDSSLLIEICSIWISVEAEHLCFFERPRQNL